MRLILTTTVPSSTNLNLTFFAVAFEIGPFAWRGMGGLRNAPLNFTINMMNPRRVPWGPPPERELFVPFGPLPLIYITDTR